MKKSLLLIISLVAVITCSSGTKVIGGGLGSEEEDTEEPSFPGAVGGPCKYEPFNGKVKIISVEKDKEKSPLYQEPMVVMYNFIPENSEAPKKYKFKNFKDTSIRFWIGTGENPPARCLDEYGIKVNSEHKAVRLEITKGTCTPVLFKLVDIDENRCANPGRGEAKPISKSKKK